MTAESTASKKARIMGSWLVQSGDRFTNGDAASHLQTPRAPCSEDTARTLLYSLYEDSKLCRHVYEDGSVKYSGNVLGKQMLRSAWVGGWVSGLIQTHNKWG